MTTRLLPRDEWHRLKGTLLETVTPSLRHDAQIVVVEDGDRIVGCWALMPVYHAEGLWVDPAYRTKVSVGRRLLDGMTRIVRDGGIREVLVMATNPRMERMVRKFGDAAALDGAHFSVGMGR